MKSYYGNLVADILEFLFAIASLVLVWQVNLNSNEAQKSFIISIFVYLLPRFLVVIYGIDNNRKDILRFFIDLFSLLMLFACFILACIFWIRISNNKVISVACITIFYAFSGLSLFDIAYKIAVGISQKAVLLKARIKY